MTKLKQFFDPGNPDPECGREAVEDGARRVILNVPFGVTSFLFDPVQEFFIPYLQPRHIFLEVVDQFFRVTFSTAAFTPSNSTAAAIFHDGLT